MLIAWIVFMRRSVDRGTCIHDVEADEGILGMRSAAFTVTLTIIIHVPSLS